MKTKLQKIKCWIFRDSLELNKHWWHRLIKVAFLSIFFLASIGSLIGVILYPERDFLSSHNIKINNTLYSFTENYKGQDYDNTIPIFFKQDGNFGVLTNNRIEYVSLYTLGNDSFCVNNPEKYKEGIINIYYTNYKKSLRYDQTPDSLETFKSVAEGKLFQDSTRKCFLNGLQDEDLKQIEHLSSVIINYKPSLIYYLEAIILVPVLSFISFILFALVYYRIFLYIIYGNKK